MEIIQISKLSFEVLIFYYIMFLLGYATFFHKYQLFWMATDNTILERALINHNINV